MEIAGHYRVIRSTLWGLTALGMLIAQVNGTAAQTAPKLEDTVVFAKSGGPGQETIQKCAEQEFTAKTGVRVEFLSIQTPQALARVMVQRNNPTIDVVWSNPSSDYTGFKEGVFIPIAKEMVPNLAKIDPKFMSDTDIDKGVPVSTSILGIQYNTRIFKEKGWEPPSSWQDLWDPKYRGHVEIYSLGGGSGQAILAVAAFLNGGASTNYDKAFEYLAKLKPNLFNIFDQSPPVDAAILDGNVWLGASYSGRPLSLMQQGDSIGFVQPKEGTVVNNVTLSIVKGAPHPNAAVAFVNWMLSNEAQSCLVLVGNPPVVKGVEVPADMAPFFMVQRPIIPMDAAAMQERLPELLKRWNKEIGSKE